ncbi:MAG: adenylyl-sulfate kinase [Thermoleophilia bacterium]
MTRFPPSAETITNRDRRVDRAPKPIQRSAVVWLTGLSAAGKSTIARHVADELQTQGRRTYVLDGDELRSGLCSDLGFSLEDRAENVRRAAEVARVLFAADLTVLCTSISPLEIDRSAARSIVGGDDFLEVYVQTPIEECIARDPKGLYRRALNGEIPDFTGISSPYEVPLNPELVIDTSGQTLDACVRSVLELLDAHTSRP